MLSLLNLLLPLRKTLFAHLRDQGLQVVDLFLGLVEVVPGWRRNLLLAALVLIAWGK